METSFSASVIFERFWFLVLSPLDCCSNIQEPYSSTSSGGMTWSIIGISWGELSFAKLTQSTWISSRTSEQTSDLWPYWPHLKQAKWRPSYSNLQILLHIRNLEMRGFGKPISTLIRENIALVDNSIDTNRTPDVRILSWQLFTYTREKVFVAEFQKQLENSYLDHRFVKFDLIRIKIWP